MAVKWIKTSFPGVRFYEHAKRKHGVKYDRYFTIRYKQSGKSKEEGLGWSSEGWTAEKAAIQLGELKRAYKTGEGAARLSEKRKKVKAQKAKEARKNITFNEFFTQNYIPIAKADKKPESSRKEAEHFEKWLRPILGDHPLVKIVPLDLERVKKAMMDAGRSPRSIQYVFATFRQCWNMAKRDGFVAMESPTKRVKLPKLDNQRIRFLSHEQADLLLENLKNRSIQLHSMALLSLQCGLRASEIFNLKWMDVNIKKGHMTIWDAKTGTRTAFMTEDIKLMFQDMNNEKSNELVFPDRNGEKAKKISNAFQRAVDELGLNTGITDRRQRVVFHSLRHTYASWLVEGGTDLYVVQKLMGHKTLAMTERYSHLRPGVLQKAIRNLGERIKDSKKKKIIQLTTKIGG